MMHMQHGETGADDEKEMGEEKCGMNHCMHFKHRGVRMLAAIIVVIFVFWCGFQFGEIRILAGSHQGDYRMMQGGWGGGALGQ
ncbi:MAG: hypothetical protein ACYC4I_00440 [Minisyncoccota bacterium]